MAELSAPFPPGEYPVVVVGSGPGALQISYSLSRVGVEHAVISADPSPGGMFRRWPFFQRLLSWTKPHAPAARGTRAYERYDWNSLLGADPSCRAIQPGLMDGTSYFPSRPEMEANLVAFADKGRVAVRQDCRWTGTRRVAGPDGDRFELETSDGIYRARVVVVAVGVAEPYTPPGVGMDHTIHYAQVQPAESYADRRVFIIGKQNSGFELATGLLPWARQLVLSSPSTVKLSVETRTLVGVRARYVQPYEDNVLGGGVSVLDASIDRIERAADGPLTWASRPSARAGSPSRRRSGRARRCRASSSAGRSARARGASRSTACPPTPVRSTVPVTTAGCSRRASRRRSSDTDQNDRIWRPMLSRASSPVSWPRLPSCSTSAATSRAS
jgi:hypothetical protein